jgi:type VI secretion system protein ImpE
MMEVIVKDRYYWLPFTRIARIVIEPPSDLRDQVWMPVKLLLVNGGETVGLTPTRYPGSEQSADPRVRLARKTEWQEVAADTFEGKGQRILATDTGEYPIMDIRAIDLDHASSAAEDTANG